MKIVEVKTYLIGTPPPHHGGRCWVFLKLTTFGTFPRANLTQKDRRQGAQGAAPGIVSTPVSTDAIIRTLTALISIP